jgi:hypothetical protein
VSRDFQLGKGCKVLKPRSCNQFHCLHRNRSLFDANDCSVLVTTAAAVRNWLELLGMMNVAVIRLGASVVNLEAGIELLRLVDGLVRVTMRMRRAVRVELNIGLNFENRRRVSDLVVNFRDR